MHITDIRRHNLTEWFKDRTIPEKEKSYISQLKSGRNSFGEKAARRLEKTYGMGELYLDRPPQNNGISILSSSLTNSPINNSIVSATHTHYAGENKLAQDEPDGDHYHKIDYLDVRAAAGLVEYSNSDYPEVIKQIWLSDDGLLELVGRRSANGLHIINVPTDSMEPTIPKGSPVVIDTKVNGYIGDGTYAFSVDGNLFIKRIQKLMKGGYKIISDNKERYDPEEINDEYLNNATFVGKFLKVWKIKTEDL